MRRVLLCWVLVMAWPSLAAEALSIKGIRLGQPMAAACANAEPDPPGHAEALRAIPGYIDQGQAACRVPVESFAGQPVKDGVAHVAGMRGKVVFVRVVMQGLSETELVELGTAMMLAYGKATPRKPKGTHLSMQWGRAAERLELVAFTSEPDSLHRPWITLENPQLMAQSRALDAKNAKAMERHQRNLEMQLQVLKASERASDLR